MRNKNGGIGFLGLLTIVFIIMKLTNTIFWSWLWVLSPLWIPIAFATLIFVYLFIIALTQEFIILYKENKNGNKDDK